MLMMRARVHIYLTKNSYERNTAECAELFCGEGARRAPMATFYGDVQIIQ